MITIRCTARLIARLKKTAAVESSPPASTTRLGDLYANLVFVGRRQFVLGTSERCFLPIVVDAAPIDSLPLRLRDGLFDILRALEVPQALIENECAAMNEEAGITFAKTASRQVLGVMNEFAMSLEVYVVERYATNIARSLHLADMPCSPLYKGAITPAATTKLLFGLAPPDRSIA